MTDACLYLVRGNKNRIGKLEWFLDDYDVREGAPDGRLVGRIYKLSVAPTGLWWFWAVQIFPAMARVEPKRARLRWQPSRRNGYYGVRLGRHG